MPRHPPQNNIQLDDIARSVNANNLIFHSDRRRTHLNHIARSTQTIRIEEKIIEGNRESQNAPDAVRARYFQEFHRGIDPLEQEQQKINIIQDPPSMRGRRTHGRGGKCLRTGAEIADKELRDQQKLAEREARYQQREGQASSSRNENTSIIRSANAPNPPVIDPTNPRPATRGQLYHHVQCFSSSGSKSSKRSMRIDN